MTTNNRAEGSKTFEDALKNAGMILEQRFLHFCFASLGHNAEIKTQNGSKTNGIFYTANMEEGGIILKHCSSDQDQFRGDLGFDRQEIVHVLIPNVEDPPFKTKKRQQLIKTDEEISKKKSLSNRQLVKWDDADYGAGNGNQLEGSIEQISKKSDWNQFDVNQKIFGINSVYSDDHYTTRLDMASVDAKTLEKAIKYENEILNQKTEFRHIAEERGVVDLKEENEDEETLYSAVIKEGNNQQKRTEEDSNSKFAKKSDGIPRFTNFKKIKEETTSSSLAGKKLDEKTNTNKLDEKAIQKLDGKIETRTEKLASQEKSQSERSEIQKNDSEDTKSENLRDQAASKTGNLKDQKVEVEKKPLQKQTAPIRTAQEDSNQDLNQNVNKEPAKKLNPLGLAKKISQNKEGETPKEGGWKRNKPEPRELRRDMFNETAIQKFKIKITDKDLAKTGKNFQDYVLDNWEKKSSGSNPTSFDPRWAEQKKIQEIIPSTANSSTSLQSKGLAFQPTSNLPNSTNIQPGYVYGQQQASPYPSMYTVPQQNMMYPYGGFSSYPMQPMPGYYQDPMQMNYNRGQPGNQGGGRGGGHWQ